MRKTIILSIVLLGAIGSQAQTIPPNPGTFWTNEVATFTNIVLNSATPIPLSKDAHSAAVATAVKWNQEFGLTQATNRFGVKDVMASWAWHWGERHAAIEWRTEQENKADILLIRAKLPDATDSQLTQIKAILSP